VGRPAADKAPGRAHQWLHTRRSVGRHTCLRTGVAQTCHFVYPWPSADTLLLETHTQINTFPVESARRSIHGSILGKQRRDTVVEDIPISSPCSLSWLSAFLLNLCRILRIHTGPGYSTTC
jgi:hypothetical protein